jgi:hypothetical protein
VVEGSTPQPVTTESTHRKSGGAGRGRGRPPRSGPK